MAGDSNEPIEPLATSSFHYHVAASAGIIFPQDEGQEEHDGCTHRKDHEDIDVREAGCVRLDVRVDSGVGLHTGFIRAEAGMRESLGKAIESVLEIGIIGAGVIDQNLLMKL